ncbi:MAG: HAD family hydrolase [Oscillospiraceae bacterium]
MKLPEMILFDYGHTLLYEPGADPLGGDTALFPYITKNPNNYTPADICRITQEICAEVYDDDRRVDFHENNLRRMLNEYLEIELAVSFEEAERIVWNGISAGAVMPGAPEMLALLREKGIRTGVISNLTWSGAALAERIARLLPEHRFDFILASSEYVCRKPSRFLFELALKKAKLAPEQVWFCGDSAAADVLGAQGAGIFPVLYESAAVENPWAGRNDDVRIDGDYLHICDWRELTDALDALGSVREAFSVS